MISFGFEEEVARKALEASVKNWFTDLEFLRFLLEIVVLLICHDNPVMDYFIIYRAVILRRLLNGYLILLLVCQIWILHQVAAEMWWMLLYQMDKEVSIVFILLFKKIKIKNCLLSPRI